VRVGFEKWQWTFTFYRLQTFRTSPCGNIQVRIELSVKSRNSGARTTSFNITGHQTWNCDENFTKQNNWDPN
jgi:galactose mutarotase-like enzyme